MDDDKGGWTMVMRVEDGRGERISAEAAPQQDLNYVAHARMTLKGWRRWTSRKI